MLTTLNHNISMVHITKAHHVTRHNVSHMQVAIIACKNNKTIS